MEAEQLRQRFKEETGKKLWTENFHSSEGFSDEYVNWLETKILFNGKI